MFGVNITFIYTFRCFFSSPSYEHAQYLRAVERSEGSVHSIESRSISSYVDIFFTEQNQAEQFITNLHNLPSSDTPNSSAGNTDSFNE